jgi:hypothetical protein
MNKKYQLISTLLEQNKKVIQIPHEEGPLPADPNERQKEIERRKRMMRKATGLAMGIGAGVTGLELMASHGPKGYIQSLKGKGIKALAPYAVGAGFELAAEPAVQWASNKLEDRYQRKLKEKQLKQQGAK